MRRTRGVREQVRRRLVTACLLALILSLFSPVSAQVTSVAGIEATTAAARSRAFEPAAQIPEALGIYDVVALRVEFQPDTTRFTTGDGTFDGPLYADGLRASIDPLPHDAGHFEAHLAFLRHYVSVVSDGRAQVRTHLLPDVVRVSGRMGDYSPTGPGSDSDSELAKLATLAREAWGLAAEPVDLSGIDPERTAFVLFHAGVGRDIELVGTTLEKTPEDLPSLFFGPEALGRLAPGPTPTLAGVPVTNTLVMPRTETRQGFDFIADEPYLAEFSINGMLAASFLNFLGVPDLFDTETGQSAIGPFGVMDGLGIFAMNGLFPPQPSAWTRVALGWTDPVIVDPTDQPLLELAHAGAIGGHGVALVPISDGEYFLVEVRHRDPTGSGVRLTVMQGGAEKEVLFANEDETFNPVTVAGFPGGVVMAAEPYDFALPGGLDADGDPLLGGALIWHVDERVLEAGLAENRVNADASRRAIDLEEADGAQDIGHPSGGFFGPTFDLGSPFDFWYEGNPVSVVSALGEEIALYENRFGPDTVPSSESASGGPGFVVIGGFSTPAPTMSFAVSGVAEGGISPPVTAWDRPVTIDEKYFAEFGLFRLTPDGPLVHSNADDDQGVIVYGDQVVEDVLAAEPAVDDAGWAYYLALGRAGRLRTDGAHEWADLPTDDVRKATTPVVLTRSDPPEFYAGVLGDRGPQLLRYDDGVVTLSPEPEVVKSLAVTDDGRLVVAGQTEVRVEGGLTWSYEDFGLGLHERFRPAFGRDREGLFGVLTGGRTVALHLPDGTVHRVPERVPCWARPLGCSGARSDDAGDAEPVGHYIDGATRSPVLADLDDDGLLEAVVLARNLIWAFHRSGAVVAGFPIRLSADAGPGAPLVTRLGGSVSLTIVVGLSNGTVDAYNLSDGGRRLPGFPLAVGTGSIPTPTVGDDWIAAIDGDGTVRRWDLGRTAESAMALTSADNASFVSLVDTPDSKAAPASLFDPSETYNWPNPVQGAGATWIRFAVTESADVTIRIIDLAGRRVAELERTFAPQGVPVEVGWQADVPSGVYIARLRAQTDGGRSEDRLVKIGVIR